MICFDSCGFITCYDNGILERLYANYKFATVTRVVEESHTVPSRYFEQIPVHQVTIKQLRTLKKLVVEPFGNQMPTKGEFHLWAYAISLPHDKWQICGPDQDIVRIGCDLGLEHKIVSVEQLLRDKGFHRDAERILADLRYRHLSIEWLDEKIRNKKQGGNY